jgi:LysB family phage lysis regulatory protein
MKEIAAKLVCGLLAALLVLSGGLYIKSLRAELETAQDDIEDAHQDTLDRDETIRKLLAAQRRNDLARKQLQTAQTGIRSQLATRESLIRKLQNENDQFRAWAALSLPDAVVRLRQHGEITGAAAYRERMSQGAAVQPAGGGRPD